MSGVTKKIYERDIIDVKKMWKKQLRSIMDILPSDYSEEDIILNLKEFYPHEWKSVEIKFYYYQKKDRYIKKQFGKARYEMPSPVELLKTVFQYQKLMESTYRKEYAINYNREEVSCKRQKLWDKRKTKIQKVDRKIETAKLKTQRMTPDFIDELIGLYERKTTSQKDRMYIILELKKYYGPKIIQFFFKLNDTELNKQLRRIAFEHLQSFNYNPRLRKQKHMRIHTKNKKRRQYLKKVYSNETYIIPYTPQELEYRIENAPEQIIKRYDFFISHSSSDSQQVQELITFENRHRKNVFCDWINDSDYLKRYLVCDATLRVIEKRLEQSNALIFVRSEHSSSSKWCKYELNYFDAMQRPIYCIDINDIENGQFNVQPIKEKWFLDPNYEEMVLVGK